jgi:hypothetical protein
MFFEAGSVARMTWFYKSHTGAEYGPVGPVELLDLIRNGTVLRDTLVKKDDSQWVKVEEVNGLLANAAKPSIAYFCPTCGKQVTKPPCRCHRCDLHVDKATQKMVQHDLDEVDRKARKAIAKAKVAVKESKKLDESKVQSSEEESVGAGYSRTAVSSKSKAESKDGFGVAWLSWLRKKR